MTLDERKIVIHESIGDESNGQSYSIDRKSNKITRIGKMANYFNLIELFKMIFLPEGFPHTVSQDYISYQIWDTIQAFCSSLSGALAARAVLQSIGVGNEKATAYGATLTWLIKDGTGMIGRILFAWQKGPYLDSNSKMWRLYADIMNDLSFFVDLLAPFSSDFFTIYVISFSGLLKSLVGVAGGATRSALTQHQARNNNLADVSAKDSSQETLVNLIGLVFNIVLLNIVKDSNTLIWPLFILFVLGHLFANYKAVKSLIMETFNFNRFRIAVVDYFSTNSVLSPLDANRREPVLFALKHNLTIKFGCKLDLVKNFNLIDFTQFSKEKYFVEYDLKNKKAVVLIHKDYSHLDLIKCLFQIELVEYVFLADKTVNADNDIIELKNKIHRDDSFQTILRTVCEKKFQDFVERAKKNGWNLNYTQFPIDKYRYSFD